MADDFASPTMLPPAIVRLLLGTAAFTPYDNVGIPTASPLSVSALLLTLIYPLLKLVDVFCEFGAKF